MKKAYFAGGCFWCITPVFYQIKGVAKVISGYCGGQEVNPTYLQVKHQLTGHRETICVEYDETTTNYQKLLETFISNVDLYDDGGQYIDRGFSYTLAIFYNDEKERMLINERLSKFEKKVYVDVLPFEAFYEAEEEHQDYFKKNPESFEKEMKVSGRI